jgi:hypothetical protein
MKNLTIKAIPGICGKPVHTTKLNSSILSQWIIAYVEFKIKKKIPEHVLIYCSDSNTLYLYIEKDGFYKRFDIYERKK